MRLHKTTLCLCLLGSMAATNSALAQNKMPLTLPQAIDLALKQNRELKLAQLAVVDSEHKKEIARSAYYPHISNESKFTHITELAGVEIPAGAFGNHPDTGLIPGQTLFLAQGLTTNYTSGTGLQQPVTQMLRIRESNRAAAADIKSAKAQANQTQNQIALKVRHSTTESSSPNSNSRLRRKRSPQSRSSCRKVWTPWKGAGAGRGCPGESRLRSRCPAAGLVQRLQIRDLTISFDDLLGLPLNTNLVLEADSSAPVPVRSREECIRIAQDRSPEIQAARQNVEKAKAGLAAAKEEYIPDVTARGTRSELGERKSE